MIGARATGRGPGLGASSAVALRESRERTRIKWHCQQPPEAEGTGRRGRGQAQERMGGNWDESARVGTTACVRPRARGRRASREQGGLTGHGCLPRSNQSDAPAGLRLCRSMATCKSGIPNRVEAGRAREDGGLVGGLVRCGSPTVTHGWDVVTNRAESPTNARAHGCSPAPPKSERLEPSVLPKLPQGNVPRLPEHARTTGSLPVPGPVVGGDYVHFR